jgi:hypothetical protein
LVILVRQKDAGVNATFPEVFEYSISASDYEQNILKVNYAIFPVLSKASAFMIFILWF